MTLRHLAGLIFLSLASFAHAQDPIFDTHVHIWNGEKSVQEYLGQVKSTGLPLTAEEKRKIAGTMPTGCSGSSVLS